MDQNLRKIADYAASIPYESLTDSVIKEIIRHHLDGIGCAAGGFPSEPCEIAREFASTAPVRDGASVFGVANPTAVPYAAFSNASHVRHLDFNDVYPGRVIGGGHPNDMAPAILAAVEAVGGTGKDVILGIHIAYEVFGAMADTYAVRDKGWDQGAHASIGATAGVGRILGLDGEQIANAVSLVMTMGLPLRVVRTGELSHWKGCATAHATLNAVVAAQLAKRGMTGPTEPFTGTDAFERHVDGPLDLQDLGKPVDDKFVMERGIIKFFPSEYSTQGPVASTLGMRDRAPADKIQSIRVETYYEAWHEIGGGQGDRAQKWDPQTRESADHSLPYMMAVALVDGHVSIDSFVSERVKDPQLRPLMNKIEIVEDEELSRLFRGPSNESVARITITLDDGEVIQDEVRFPRGHFNNPMSDDEISLKFMGMAPNVMPANEAKRVLDILWGLEDLRSLDELTANFRSWSRQ